MESRLEQILKRYLNGRDTVIWGTPTRTMLRTLKSYKCSNPKEADPSKHYIVAVTEEDYDDFLLDEQSSGFKHIEDCTYAGEEGELPFQWECYGVKIGRWTYFGKGITEGCKNGYIESIGHFTSINGSADVGVNHQLNMIFTSDDICHLFTDKNKEQFNNKLRTDPQHPYAYGKNRIVIGNDVYIGANAFINASKVTKIGDGAIIGAGAVVLEDVPPYAVITGVPATIKRFRFAPDVIAVLQRVQWWNWSEEEINANMDALISPDIFIKRFESKL